MTEVFVPRENVNDDAVTVSSISIADGDITSKGNIVAQIETSKTNIDIEAPVSGIIRHKLYVGIEIPVGALLFSIDSPVILQSPAETDKISPVGKEVEPKNPEVSLPKFSKAATELAARFGVDLRQFESGWITGADISKSLSKRGVEAGAVSQPPVSTDSFDEQLDISNTWIKVPNSRRKQAEIRSLLVGSHAATTSTIGVEIVLPGPRLVAPPFLFSNSISDLVVFESSKLLKQYPALNGAYINEKFRLEYEQVNFGWSFDNGDNLKVLSIKNSDRLTLMDIQNEVMRLLEIYESGGTIPLNLLTDSTVSVSDLSRTEASFMLPLINGRQALNLGIVSKSKGLFEIIASFDHRVSDGLALSTFLSDLKKRVLSYYLDEDGNVDLSCFICSKTIKEELADGHHGFISFVSSDGSIRNMCRHCFDGW